MKSYIYLFNLFYQNRTTFLQGTDVRIGRIHLAFIEATLHLWTNILIFFFFRQFFKLQ